VSLNQNYGEESRVFIPVYLGGATIGSWFIPVY